MMYLAPTCDHRIVDGRETVLFLRRIKEIIETRRECFWKFDLAKELRTLFL